jgi:hypothetical protein
VAIRHSSDEPTLANVTGSSGKIKRTKVSSAATAIYHGHWRSTRSGGRVSAGG